RPVDMWEFLLFIVISHRRRELVDVEHQHPVRPRIGGVELIGNPKKGIEPVGRVNESVLLEGLGYVGPGGTLRLPDRLRRQVIRNAGIARLVDGSVQVHGLLSSNSWRRPTQRRSGCPLGLYDARWRETFGRCAGAPPI